MKTVLLYLINNLFEIIYQILDMKYIYQRTEIISSPATYFELIIEALNVWSQLWLFWEWHQPQPGYNMSNTQLL